MLITIETTAPDTAIVEANYGTGRQDYSLTVIAVTGPDTIRVRIKVDSYTQQSYAVAEVLAADNTWTDLLDEPAGDWHPFAPSYATRSDAVKRATVEELADRLLYRAATVLTAARTAAERV